MVESATLIAKLSLLNIATCVFVVWLTKHYLLPQTPDTPPVRWKKFTFGAIWNFPAILFMYQLIEGINHACRYADFSHSWDIVWFIWKAVAIYGLLPFAYYIFFVMPQIEAWFRRMGFKWGSGGAELF